MQIEEYVAAWQEREMQKFKDSAVLLDGLATQLRRYFTIKKSEWVGPKELYPKVFGESQAPQPVNMAPERKQKVIVSTWKSFLGV